MDATKRAPFLNRELYSSVLVRVANDAAAKTLIDRIEADKRLPLRREREFNITARRR